jgi:hypothetical protein
MKGGAVENNTVTLQTLDEKAHFKVPLPDIFSYHCAIHQQDLCTKVINFQHVMSVVQKVVNSIRARPLQTSIRRN